MARLPGVSDRDARWGAKVAFYIMKRRFTKMTGRETETMLDPLRMYAHIPNCCRDMGGWSRRWPRCTYSTCAIGRWPS
jgi:hypothetical protein